VIWTAEDIFWPGIQGYNFYVLIAVLFIKIPLFIILCLFFTLITRIVYAKVIKIVKYIKRSFKFFKN